jgi:ribosome-associated translation inhibitor RaiA
MKEPPRIQFHGMAFSDALEAAAREHANALDSYGCDLKSCQVDFEVQHHHRKLGRPFSVRVGLTLQGCDLMVGRLHHADASVALHNAFDSLHRHLAEVVRAVPGGK